MFPIPTLDTQTLQVIRSHFNNSNTPGVWKVEVPVTLELYIGFTETDTHRVWAMGIDTNKIINALPQHIGQLPGIKQEETILKDGLNMIYNYNVMEPK